MNFEKQEPKRDDPRMTMNQPAPEHDPVLRLLRLKRHEVPSADYFERLIEEFHRRQTAELLRRPVWRLALDRVAARLVDPVFGLAPAGRVVAGAAAALVLGAVALGSGLVMPRGQEEAGRFAAADGRPASGLEPADPVAGARAHEDVLSTANRLSQVPDLERIFAASPAGAGRGSLIVPGMESFGYGSGVRRAVSAPRYVIDARPVSQESPVLSF